MSTMRTQAVIQSVERAFAVASARDIDLPGTTVIRLLNTMQQIEVITKNEESDDYQLSEKMLNLLDQAAGEDLLEVTVQNGMQHLSAETGETICYCMPSGDQVLYVSQLNARHAVQMGDWVGRTVPLYGTAVEKITSRL